MSERDDDVLELSDLREWADSTTGAVRDRHVGVAIVLAVLGASLALALVPHTLGGLGGSAIDTGDGIATTDGSGEDAQQLYQNYVTNVASLFAPSLLVMVGAIAAFVGAARSHTRTDQSRWTNVGVAALAAGVGVALGYVLFVLGSHLAYGETAQGYIVQEFPVRLNVGAIATNAVSLAVTAAIGSTLAAAAGTLVASDGSPRAAISELADEETAASGSEDRTWEGVEPDEEGSLGDGESGDETAATTGDESETETPDRVETADRASDYRETGPTADSDAPQYDPDDRDWDGSGGD